MVIMIMLSSSSFLHFSSPLILNVKVKWVISNPFKYIPFKIGRSLGLISQSQSQSMSPHS